MCRAASQLPSHVENVTPAVARYFGLTCIRIQASVMIPRIPSLPIAMRFGSGPAPPPGRRLLSHHPDGVSIRTDSTNSSMCVWFVA